MPIRVNVRPAGGCFVDQCYVNVAKKIEIAGGYGLYGWKILEFQDLFFQALHHAVWVDHRERIIDVTPDVRKWKQQVFCPDMSTKFAGVPSSPLLPYVLNVSGLPEIDEALEISHQLTMERVKAVLPNGMLPAMDDSDPQVIHLREKAQSLLLVAQSKVLKK